MYMRDFEKMAFGALTGVALVIVAKVAFSLGREFGKREADPSVVSTTYYVPWTEHKEDE